MFITVVGIHLFVCLFKKQLLLFLLCVKDTMVNQTVPALQCYVVRAPVHI